MPIDVTIQKTAEEFATRENRFQKRYLDHEAILNSVRYYKGGHIITTANKVNVTSTPTLIVGLGGLGCTTLTLIKDEYENKINDLGDKKHVAILGVDTCEADIKQRRKSDNLGGNLDDDEVVHLWRAGDKSAALVPLLLKGGAVAEGMPQMVWFDKQLNDGLTPQGASRIRQKGRLQLSIAESYDAVYDMLLNALRKFPVIAHKINVMLVSGISGGTGSGTIIDIGYMIRLALNELHMSADIQALVFGPNVNNNPEHYATYCRNFTAALKEIENFSNASVTKVVYTFPNEKFGIDGVPKQSDGTVVPMNDVNLFDGITLIQGYAGGKVMEVPEVLRSVAGYVTHMISSIEATDDAGNPAALYAAVADNHLNDVGPKIQAFMQSHTHSNTEGVSVVSAPTDMIYDYRSVGFSASPIPEAQLMAVFSSNAMQKVVAKMAANRDEREPEILEKVRMLFSSVIDGSTYGTMNAFGRVFALENKKIASVGPLFNGGAEPAFEGIAGYQINTDLMVVKNKYDRGELRFDGPKMAKTIYDAFLNEAKTELANYGPMAAEAFCRAAHDYLSAFIKDVNERKRDKAGNPAPCLFDKFEADSNQEMLRRRFENERNALIQNLPKHPKDVEKETARNNFKILGIRYLGDFWKALAYKDAVAALKYLRMRIGNFMQPDVYSTVESTPDFKEDQNIFRMMSDALYMIQSALGKDVSDLTKAVAQGRFAGNIIDFSGDILSKEPKRLGEILSYFTDDVAKVDQLCKDIFGTMFSESTILGEIGVDYKRWLPNYVMIGETPSDNYRFSGSVVEHFEGQKCVSEALTKFFRELNTNFAERLSVLLYTYKTLGTDNNEMTVPVTNVFNAFKACWDAVGLTNIQRWVKLQTEYFQREWHLAPNRNPFELAANKLYTDLSKISLLSKYNHNVPNIDNSTFAQYNTLIIRDRTESPLMEEIYKIASSKSDFLVHGHANISSSQDAVDMLGLRVEYGIPLFAFEGMEDYQKYYEEVFTPDKINLPHNRGVHQDCSVKAAWPEFSPAVDIDVLNFFYNGNEAAGRAHPAYLSEEKILTRISKQTEACIEDFKMIQLNDANPNNKFYMIKTIESSTAQVLENYRAAVRSAIADSLKAHLNFADGDAGEIFKQAVKERMPKDSMFEWLDKAKVQMTGVALNLTDICPHLDKLDRGEHYVGNEKQFGGFIKIDRFVDAQGLDRRISNANFGGLYKTIRRSSQFRHVLADTYEACMDLNRQFEQIMEEECRQYVEDVVNAQEKHFHSDMVKCFLMGRATGYWTLGKSTGKDKDGRPYPLLRVRFMLEGPTKQNSVKLIEETWAPVSSLTAYEKGFGVYGLFMSFLKYMKSLSTEKRNAYIKAISDEYDQRWEYVTAKDPDGNEVTGIPAIRCLFDKMDELFPWKDEFNDPWDEIDNDVIEEVNSAVQHSNPKMFKDIREDTDFDIKFAFGIHEPSDDLTEFCRSYFGRAYTFYLLYRKFRNEFAPDTGSNGMDVGADFEEELL